MHTLPYLQIMVADTFHQWVSKKTHRTSFGDAKRYPGKNYKLKATQGNPSDTTLSTS